VNGRDHSEDLDVDGTNTGIELSGKGWEVVDRIHLYQDGTSGRLL
jgi:hypothetical protein